MGLVTRYTLGNGTQVNMAYDTYFNKTTKIATLNAITLYSQEININGNNGNLNWRKDNVKNQYESFTYDFDRLKDEILKNYTTGATISTRTSSYATNGNISQTPDLGLYTYAAPVGSVGQFAVSSTANKGTYASQTQNITYNANNKVYGISNNSPTTNGIIDQVQFTYGDDGQRRMMVYTPAIVPPSTTAAVQTTYYIDGGEYQADLDSYLHYFGGPDGTVAIYNSKPTPTAVQGELYYTFTDYLGSLELATTETGTEVLRQSFDAWGNHRNPANWALTQAAPANSRAFGNRGYTGHEHLYAFQLINMNGRLYDPVLHRMLIPDPVVADATNAQSYNSYAYALNNPLKYTDPDGNEVVTVTVLTAIAIGAAIGAGTAAVSYVVAHGIANDWQFNNFSWGEFGKSVLFGAAIGAASAGVGQAFGGVAIGGQAVKQAGLLTKLLNVNAPTKLLGQIGWEGGRAAAHSLAQGGLASLQSGEFEGGAFASGAFSSFGGSLTQNIKAPVAVHVAFGALLGGAASEIGGGSFLQGAVIGGFVNLLNHQAHGGILLTWLNKLFPGKLMSDAVDGMIDIADDIRNTTPLPSGVTDELISIMADPSGGGAMKASIKISPFLAKRANLLTKFFNNEFTPKASKYWKNILEWYRDKVAKPHLDGTTGKKVTDAAKQLHINRTKQINDWIQKYFK
ncbi:MAG: hypothetical protein EAZ53_01880 [Bacteroidetes bacterium]|nr:MAG: hypothetical protein EAZ53_01880 [Bacteroidota bacterium]